MREERRGVKEDTDGKREKDRVDALLEDFCRLISYSLINSWLARLTFCTTGSLIFRLLILGQYQE